MMKRFEKYNEIHANAIASIKRRLEPGEYEPHMHLLVRWMLETDVSPYSYLPEGWAGALGTATGFDSLLSTMAHAIYDDGDITFVTVNDEPRIVFMHQHDDGFEDLLLSSTERNLKARGSTYTIKVLDIEPNAFGALYDEYARADLIHRFSMDAAAHGVEFAAHYYSGSPHWCDAIVETAQDEIARYRKLFGHS